MGELVPTPPLDAGLRRRLAAVDRAHAALADELARPTRFAGALRRRARAESVEASTAIEGFRVAPGRSLALVSGEVVPDATSADEQAVACYSRALDHVLMLADDPHFAWDLRVLLDLHFDCCWFQWDRSPGRLRTTPIAVVGPDGVRYTGPAASEVPALLAELVEWLEADDAHPVVRAAMAHLHLAAIHPYRDGNGRSARILQSLVLARAGVVALGFSSIEPYLAASTAAYYEALERVQHGSWEARGDASGWVAFCLDAHLHQARARIALVEAAGRRWARLEKAVAARGWPQRLVIALEQASVTGGVWRARYAAEAEISAGTASADLRRLADAGLLRSVGRGRAAHHVPGPGLDAVTAA